MTDFAGLGIAETLLRALNDEGYTTPTPIQARSIPALLEGKDLLGIAQTGTGKTAAFALPILHRLLENPRRPAPMTTRALILAPTRELAVQIAESFKTYGRYTRFTVGCIVGGVAMGPQIKTLSRGVDILVATPGRLLDHMDSRRLRLDFCEVVVLDEADHMLDLGFVIPIRKILSKLPKARQSLFFSATMPREIASLAAEMLHMPTRVEVTPVSTTAERVVQEAYLIETAGKRDLLVEILGRPGVGRALIFTRTKRGADRVTEHLEQVGISAGAIHGNKSQNHRQRTLDNFRSGRTAILVATDIAARGIDVDGVTHVVNFDLPEVPEAYVHRIGRTARAGREGIAISFCDNSERGLLRGIEKLTRQTIETTDRRDPSRRRPAEPSEERAQRPFGQHRSTGAGGQNDRPAGGRSRGPRPFGENRVARDDRGPRADRPFGERPRAERPQGADRWKAENPSSQRPQGERPHGDRPKAARPQGDRPFGDRPKGPRADHGKPAHGGKPAYGKSAGGGGRPQQRRPGASGGSGRAQG